MIKPKLERIFEGYNIISVDSLKLRIPFDRVLVLEPALEGTLVLVNKATGEELKEFKQHSHKVEQDGISTYYGIESQRTADQTQKKFVVILFNSKLLHERYFEGITAYNIKNIYERIIEHQVIQVDYRDFLKGECTDTDFKKDQINEKFDRSLKTFVSHVKPSKKINRGYNSFSDPDNKGIEFGKRKKATPAYPYLKIYHKGLELEFSSYTFFRKHIRGTEGIENLIRIETTIKNKKHFRRHGISDTTLKNILSIDQDKLNEIMSKTIEVHLDKRMKIKRVDQDELKPFDQALLNSINMGMEFGLAYQVIRHNLTGSIIIDKSRKRTIDKLDSLYHDYIKGSDIDTINESQEQFFNEIGWRA